MKRHHFTIQINAPVEKVWKTMLEDKTYRQWTSVFAEGSFFEGDWSTGSKMRFLGPDENGALGGMHSEIKENRPNEYILMEHVGVVQNGEDQDFSEEFKDWAGSTESYTFTPKDGGTELVVEVDVADELYDDFGDQWPKALQKLKEIVEDEQDN